MRISAILEQVRAEAVVRLVEVGILAHFLIYPDWERFSNYRIELMAEMFGSRTVGKLVRFDNCSLGKGL